MEPNRTRAYDIDRCIVEIYDQTETQTEDVALIRRLLAHFSTRGGRAEEGDPPAADGAPPLPVPGGRVGEGGLPAADDALPLPTLEERVQEGGPPATDDTPPLPVPGGRVGEGGLRILEPFCGNGRILIPLAQDGHLLVGLDKSPPMLASAHAKVAALPAEVQGRITLRQVDVLSEPWPRGFDLVILGGNCLYELATPEEQEACIRAAAGSLRPGGYVYLDNNHMEGALAASWREPGVSENRFPTGRCADGTIVRGTTETIGFDAEKRLVRFRRTVTITRPDGAVARREWVEQKHPPSTAEMRTWLARHGFRIEALWGDRQGTPYTDAADRAIFWAQLGGEPDSEAASAGIPG